MTTTYDIAYTIAVRQEKIAALQSEVDELKDMLRDTETQAYVDETNMGRPPLVVKVTPNKRLDDKLAREVLDEDTYNNLSKQVLDTAKARAFLNNEQIEKITKVYDNKIEVQVK